MKDYRKLTAGVALALAMLAPVAAPVATAQQAEKDGQKKQQKRPRKAGDAKQPAQTDAVEQLETDDTTVARPGVSEQMSANRRGGADEDEQAEVTYYNNYLTSYRLGPEDVISITVFGLDRYSRGGITVPPDGKIDYYFVRDGLHVAGKTTQQVADEITQHLDEYIIEPKVTVALEKAMSARYYVVGDVAQPGIRIMTRRLSAYEAIMDSGGVLQTGDSKRVAVSRLKANGIRETALVNISAIGKGQAPDNYFLNPGDIVIVPGNRYKKVKQVLDLLPVISFARIFSGGF